MKSHRPMNGLRTVKLADIASEFNVKVNSNCQYPVYSVTKHRGFVRSDVYFKKQVFSQDIQGYKHVKKNQLAYATIHLDEGSIGLLSDAENAIISPMYTVFEVNQSEVCPQYLLRYLKSPPAIASYATLGRGSIHRRKAIPFERLQALTVPLPSLVEQLRIVAIMDKTDALREKRRKAINKINTLLQAVFLDMFGDPMTNPKGWKHSTFKLLLAAPLQNGTSPSNGGQVSRRVLTLSAITQGEFDPTAFKEASFAVDPLPNKAVNKLDFLICRGNGNLNLVGQGHFPDVDMNEVAYPDTMIAARIDPKVIRPEFLDTLWSTRAVRDQIERSARTTNGTHKINQTAIEQINVINPPLPLQIKFSGQVEVIKRLKGKCARSLKYLDDLFNSLQQHAFSGEFFNDRASAATLPQKTMKALQPELFD